MDGETRPIEVWRFRDAPEWCMKLSDHGGDEDWVAVIPAGHPETDPAWAWEGSLFGCCSVQRVEMGDGRIVLIGAHA